MTGRTLDFSRIRKVDPIVAGFYLVLFGLFVAGAIAGLRMSFALRMLPLTVCTLGILICLGMFAKFMSGPEKIVDPDAEEDVLSTFDGKAEATDLATLRYGGWMFAYILGLILTGLWVSTIVFTAAFLRIEYKASLAKIALIAGITLGTAWALGRMLNVTWPPGYLPF
jgi:hypothetical protein